MKGYKRLVNKSDKKEKVLDIPHYIVSEDFLRANSGKNGFVDPNKLGELILPHDEMFVTVYGKDAETFITMVDMDNGHIEFATVLDYKGVTAYSLGEMFVDPEDLEKTQYKVKSGTIEPFYGEKDQEQKLVVDISKEAISFATIFIDSLIRDKQVREASEKRTFAIKKGKKKKYITSDVTYIDTVKRITNGFARKEVNWSHSFVVRGHWRYIQPDKLGKNRSGDRSVKGKTWVTPHQKNKHLEFKNKVRIIS